MWVATESNLLICIKYKKFKYKILLNECNYLSQDISISMPIVLHDRDQIAAIDILSSLS